MPARTVLIVDDHEGYRSVAATFLRSEGYDVIGEAADGATAITLARELRPDILLLDVQLPDMTGFDVVGELGRDAEHPSTVLISSRRSSEYGSRIANSGALGFIPKDDLSGSALQSLLALT
jgi:DNA-binding NarL/FixJ family response regulator